jgi:hypothetical protein
MRGAAVPWVGWTGLSGAAIDVGMRPTTSAREAKRARVGTDLLSGVRERIDSIGSSGVVFNPGNLRCVQLEE